MRVAVFSEGRPDERVLRIFVPALLGAPVEWVDLKPIARGWPAVLNLLPAIVEELHTRGEADALVVLANADETPVTVVPGSGLPRRERLRSATDEALSRLTPRAGQGPLRVAIGVAAPCLEAWLLVGRSETSCVEADLERGLTAAQALALKKDLKQQLYGTARPAEALAMSRMAAEAKRLADDLMSLERLFPVGFGALAREVRAWR